MFDLDSLAGNLKKMPKWRVRLTLTSGLPKSWAFIESFVKEIVVSPDNAVVRYSVPMPQDSRIPGMAAEKVALHGPVLSTVEYGRAPMGNQSTFPFLLNALLFSIGATAKAAPTPVANVAR